MNSYIVPQYEIDSKANIIVMDELEKTTINLQTVRHINALDKSLSFIRILDGAITDLKNNNIGAYKVLNYKNSYVDLFSDVSFLQEANFNFKLALEHVESTRNKLLTWLENELKNIDEEVVMDEISKETFKKMTHYVKEHKENANV